MADLPLHQVEIWHCILAELDYFSLKRMSLVCRFFREILTPGPAESATPIDRALFRDFPREIRTTHPCDSVLVDSSVSEVRLHPILAGLVASAQMSDTLESIATPHICVVPYQIVHDGKTVEPSKQSTAYPYFKIHKSSVPLNLTPFAQDNIVSPAALSIRVLLDHSLEGVPGMEKYSSSLDYYITVSPDAGAGAGTAHQERYQHLLTMSSPRGITLGSFMDCLTQELTRQHGSGYALITANAFRGGLENIIRDNKRRREKSHYKSRILERVERKIRRIRMLRDYSRIVCNNLPIPKEYENFRVNDIRSDYFYETDSDGDVDDAEQYIIQDEGFSEEGYNVVEDEPNEITTTTPTTIITTTTTSTSELQNIDDISAFNGTTIVLQFMEDNYNETRLGEPFFKYGIIPRERA